MDEIKSGRRDVEGWDDYQWCSKLREWLMWDGALRRCSGGVEGHGPQGMCTFCYYRGDDRCKRVGCCMTFFSNNEIVDEFGECDIRSFGSGGKAGLLLVGSGVGGGFRQYN